MARQPVRWARSADKLSRRCDLAGVDSAHPHACLLTGVHSPTPVASPPLRLLSIRLGCCAAQPVHEVPSDGWVQAEAQTQPCIDLLQTGACPAGFACHCAHDPQQLRPRPCPTPSVRQQLVQAGLQLPPPEGQASGSFGSVLPPPANQLPAAGHAAAAIDAALARVQIEQHYMVQRATAAAAQAARAAAAALTAKVAAATAAQQGAPQGQQKVQERSRAVKREAEDGCTAGNPAKLQRSNAATGQAAQREDMTDSAHEASPPAARPAPPAGGGNGPAEQPAAAGSTKLQAAGVAHGQAAGSEAAQLAADAELLRAQVEALEHDLHEKDQVCQELQDRCAVSHCCVLSPLPRVRKPCCLAGRKRTPLHPCQLTILKCCAWPAS